MRRKKLFLIAAIAITTGATARDYITVTTNQHDSHAYAPGEVKAITFSGNTMQVNKQDGTDSYRLSDIDEVIFSLATGVYGLKADGGRLPTPARVRTSSTSRVTTPRASTAWASSAPRAARSRATPTGKDSPSTSRPSRVVSIM